MRSVHPRLHALLVRASASALAAALVAAWTLTASSVEAGPVRPARDALDAYLSGRPATYADVTLRLPAPTDRPHFAFALDHVAWATTSRSAPSTLSFSQVRAIYSCSITAWSQVGGAAGQIIRYLPGRGNDLRAAFLEEYGLSEAAVASSTPSCPPVVESSPTGQAIPPSDGTVVRLPQRESAILPYSTAAWIAQATDDPNFAVDRPGATRLGAVTGPSGTVRPVVWDQASGRFRPNPALVDERNVADDLNHPGVRYVSVVLDPAAPAYAADLALLGFDNRPGGSLSRLCAGHAGWIIRAYGLTPLAPTGGPAGSNQAGAVCRALASEMFPPGPIPPLPAPSPVTTPAANTTTTTTTRVPITVEPPRTPLGWLRIADDVAVPAFDAVAAVATAEAQPSPRGSVGFTSNCSFAHARPDDAIVRPTQPGASHLHDFFGNTSTDAFTTTASLINAGRSTCQASADRSAYWFPSAYVNGQRLDPIATSFYYHAPRIQDFASATQTIPLGLRMIAGDAKATGPQSTDVGWFEEHRNAAANHTTDSASAQMITTASTGRVIMRVSFPECWDGQHLDSPDHKSHMAYPVGDACPESHPVAIPKLNAFVTYRTEAGPGFSLASGPWYTLHGDFWNAWEPATMQRLIDGCIKRSLHCDQVSDQV